MIAGRLRLLEPVAGLLALVAGALVITVASPAAADGPTTFTNTTSIAVPATGSANQIGPASPYPSSIAVSGMSGPISSVTMTLTSFTHSIVGDVDMLLVAPTGDSLVVMSDIGNTGTFVFANNATLTLSDSGSAFPTAGNVPTGTYRPTNNTIGPDDSFPAPAPAPSSQTTFAGAFAGKSANGAWSLYAVDDTTGDVGSIAGGWSLTITTAAADVATTTSMTSSTNPSTTGASVTFTAQVVAGGTAVTTGAVQFAVDNVNTGVPVPVDVTGRASFTTSALSEGTHLVRGTYGGATGFLTSNGSLLQRVDNTTVVTGNTYCNSGPLTVPSQGPAQPYPSNITVSGLAGPLTDLRVELRGVGHAVPVDLDVMLVAPGNQANLVLLSDAGGTAAVSGADLVFDDAAASAVTAPLTSGTFRPTDDDNDGVDTFPAPAPAPSAATTLATFDGLNSSGTWSLYVNDDASGDAGTVAGGWCLTVFAQVPSTTVVTSSLNPSTVGQSVTFTATVTAGGNPVTAGTVQFSDGATVLGSPVTVAANGTATFTTAVLTVGAHSITAAYAGTPTATASQGTVTQNVDPLASTTVVTSSLNPSTVGQSVTFTATVTAGGNPVTAGTVQFSDGATVLGSPVTVAANGTATFTTAVLTVGAHSITAAYAGTPTAAASQGTVTQNVDPLASTTVVTSSLNPSTVGQSVTFTATVTAGGNPVTAGTVQFSDGATVLGSPVTVAANGTATFTTAVLTVGAHSITAAYAGTPTATASQGTVTQNVDPLASTTVVTSSLNPSTVGQSVTFTATVTAGGNPVTAGTVQFSDGATVLGSPVTVAANGTATFTTAVLTVGAHSITAAYAGTPTATASQGTVTQNVDPLASTTVVTSSLNPSTVGQSVTFTATVTAGGNPVTAGTVQFSDGATVLGSPVTVAANGTATFTTAVLTVGAHSITAAYAGTPTATASQGTVTQNIDPDADAGGPYTVAEGATLVLDAAASTAGAVYDWDLNGDGDFTDASGVAPSIPWTGLEALGIDDGPATHPISLRVTLDGRSATSTATVDVTNVGPDAVVTGDFTAIADVPFTVKVGADDPSSVDMAGTFTYTVDWGDGTPIETLTGAADPSITHTYAEAGSFSAAFTAADADGANGAPTVVTVQVLAATTTTSAPTTTIAPATTSTSTPPATTATSTAPTAGQLPTTGADTGSALPVIVTLVATGLALLAVARRRPAPRRHG